MKICIFYSVLLQKPVDLTRTTTQNGTRPESAETGASCENEKDLPSSFTSLGDVDNINDDIRRINTAVTREDPSALCNRLNNNATGLDNNMWFKLPVVIKGFS